MTAPAHPLKAQRQAAIRNVELQAAYDAVRGEDRRVQYAASSANWYAYIASYQHTVAILCDAAQGDDYTDAAA